MVYISNGDISHGIDFKWRHITCYIFQLQTYHMLYISIEDISQVTYFNWRHRVLSYYIIAKFLPLNPQEGCMF